MKQHRNTCTCSTLINERKTTTILQDGYISHKQNTLEAGDTGKEETVNFHALAEKASAKCLFETFLNFFSYGYLLFVA